MQRDWMKYGIDCVDLYVENVDGDWLEKWGEDEEEQQKIVESITAFLKSDDWVAVRVSKLLKDKSLYDIAIELEKCLSFPEPHERLFAVKKVLTGSGDAVEESNRTTSEQNTQIELLDLAEELVEKLVEILSK